jgi:hypothetical protein
MELSGIGAGLAAFAFWGFLAAVVVAGIWYDVKKRQTQQETVLRLMESGRSLEPELLDRIVSLFDAQEKRPDREFKVAALWILPVAPGLFLLGLILGAAVPEARAPLLGASALVACLGVGFWFASRVAASWYGNREDGLGGI